MANRAHGLLNKVLHRRVLTRWTDAARGAQDEELAALKEQRLRARQLRDRLNDLIHVADGRLALPRIGSNSFPRPAGTLWSWRPQLWRGPVGQVGMAAVKTKTRLGDEVAVFHDCKISELTLRQLRNTREEDLAPFGLRMDVFQFDGSFLSLVLELPENANEGLKRRHIVRLNTIVETEKPVEIFARLNIKNGPNTEQIVHELPIHQDDVVVEFDLAYADLNEKRIEGIWLDLIFEGPEMNQIIIRDLTMCRYPRAEI